MGGEIKPVTNLDQRIQQAARLGYTSFIVPKATLIKLPKGLTLNPNTDIAGSIEDLG